MKHSDSLLVALLCAAACVLLAPQGRGGTYIVSSHANIFGAGHVPPRDAPAPTGGGGGVPPVAITFPASPNQVFVFSEVTGQVDFGNPTRPTGPDGGNFGYAVTSFRGISGIRANSVGFLVGVFLDSTEPADPAPPPLDFNVIGTNFTSLSPHNGQVFFIGDGRTAQGVVQQFHAPPTATRLFLGLADSGHSGGGPGFYGDNTGWFSVTVERLSVAPDGNRGLTRSSSTPTTVSSFASPVYAASPSPQIFPLPRDNTFGYALPRGIGLAGEIEASTDLLHWLPATNVDLFFKDPDSTNYGARFYRFLPLSNPEH